MSNIKRRAFVRLAGTALAAGIIGFPYIARGANGKVVVIGGGTGGATAAKYLRLADPSLEVTLIEPMKEYHTCYLSNEVLIGQLDISTITFNYAGLEKHGIKIVHDTAIAIDAVTKTVTTLSGATFTFDRAVVAPGIDFKWDTIEGYNQQLAEQFPHAWQAGPQTLLLQKQLIAMPNGGTVIIVAPPNQYRCPPGPYERASLIAHYLQHYKPKSKVVILDAKDAFAKQPLFFQAWTKLYGFGTDNSLIQWVNAAAGGAVESFNASTMTLSGAVEDFQGDVINIIPPQKAGKIAFDSGLVEGDWCPINPRTFESTKQPGIYVIGDASNAAKMPKSAYAANSQAKVVVAAIINSLNGRPPGMPAYTSTCYSIAGTDYAFSVAGVYQPSADGTSIDEVPGSGGMTPIDSTPTMLQREMAYANSWFKNITQDTFN